MKKTNNRVLSALLALCLCLNLAIGVGPMASAEESRDIITEPASTATPIDAAGITGVVAPVKGLAPIAVGALISGDAAKYSVTSINWTDAADVALTGNFAPATVYKAAVVLTAAAGHKFVALTPTANAGTPALGVVSADAAENTLTFVISFPATGNAEVEPPTEQRLENSNPAVVFNDGADKPWSLHPPTNEDGLSYTVLKFPAAAETKVPTVTVTFTGTSITLYGQKAANGPVMSAKIDASDAGTADFYIAGASTASNVKIWEKTGLTPGQHTLVLSFEKDIANGAVEIETGKGLQLAVDYFVVNEETTPPVPDGIYTKDYEDGNAGTWVGATASVVEDPDNSANKILKLSEFLPGTAKRGIAIDTAAPKIADGTLSLKVKTSSLNNFGLVYRAEDAVNKANQFVNSPNVWFACNEGPDGSGYPPYPNSAVLQSLPINQWIEMKLQFKGNEVEIAIGGTRYGVFAASGNSLKAGVFGFRVWSPSRTVYVDDVLFTTELLDMGTLYEEPPLVVERVDFKEDYATDTPNWDGGAVGNGIVTVTVPAKGVALNKNAPDLAYALNTWRLTTEATGGFGVAFNATQGSFNAIYTAGDGAYFLRLPDGTILPLATGSGALKPNTAIKVQVIHVGDECTLYVNGVEVGTVKDARISNAAGKIGLYHPGDAAKSVVLTGNGAYELFYYENDFSDATKLGGWDKGTPTKTADDKLQLKMNFVGNAIATDAPMITDGVYEFKFKADAAGAGRIGFMFRLYKDKHQGLFYDIGSTWFWLNNRGTPDYGAVPVGVTLEADREYAVKLTAKGTAVSLELDGEQVYSGNISSFSATQGQFGFRKQFANGTFIVDDLKISELCDVRPDDVPAAPETITDGSLTVTMDKVFPRAMQYEMGGKTLLGNQNKTYGILLGGKTFYPLVTAEKAGENTLNYTLTIPTIGVTLKISYKVADKQLKMTVTDIIETGEFKVTSVGFEDGVLLSTEGGDATASHASVETAGGWFQVKDYIYDDVALVPDDGLGVFGRGYAMLSSGGLAGTVNNSGVEAADKLSARFYKDNEEHVVATIGDGTLTYRTPLDLKEGTHRDLWSTVAICGDYNGDTAVDWQDAAANYQNIRSEIFGMDTMKDNMMYIAMNFASQVQQPFLRTLDLGKSIYNYTDGFGQLVMHKGYAAEGHDDSHGDYGGHVGIRQGGAKDFNYIMEQGEDYNIKYGIHMNVSEHNPDGFYFSPEDMVRPLSANWGWIDQAYWVDEQKDILSGNRLENLDRLEETLPKLAFTYVDIYGSSTWMAADLVKNLNDRGLIAGTEFGGAMELGAAFTHWGNDKAYPNHGNNSTVLRFVKNDLNVFVTNALFNSSNMPLVGSWGNNNNVKDASLSFFNNVLPTKYLQHLKVLKMTDEQVTFTGGVKTTKAPDPKNPGKFVVNMTKNDKLMATWEWVDRDVSAQADPHAWASSDIGDATVFIPWYGEASTLKNPEEAAKTYYWNANGGTDTWDVPAQWLTDNVTAADVYQLSGDAKVKIATVNIAAGKITLTGEAETGYVLYPAGSAAPKVATTFGDGSGMANPGFERTDLSGWTVNENRGADATVIKTEQWETRLKIAGDKDQSAAVKQTITGLEGGKDYTVYLFANVGESGKLDVSVKAGAKTYTAGALPTTMRHFDQSKYFPEYRGEIIITAPYDNFQKVSVSFHVPEGATTVTLTITGTLGASGAAVYADDVTLFDALVQNHTQAGSGDHKSYALYEDFENVDQGLGAFTYSYLSGGYTHLAEYREEMEQFTDYVVDGNFSLKTNEFSKIGEAYRTRPNQVKLKANTEYEIGFLYETGVNGVYKISVKRPDGTEVYAKNLTATELNGVHGTVAESFRTGDYDDAYLSLDYLADITKLSIADGIEKPEGSGMEYYYMSLDNVYIRTADGSDANPDPDPEPEPDPDEGYVPPSKTETVTNEDGSKTTIKTDRRTGTVTETTKHEDGKVEKVVTKKDGSVDKTVTEADGKKIASVTSAAGDKTIAVTSKDGEKVAELNLPAVVPTPEVPFTDVAEDFWAKEAIDTVTGLGLFTGTAEGVFSGADFMTRGMLTTVLHRLSGELVGGENTFADVPADAWFTGSVAWAAQNGIVTGNGDGFDPDGNITRESLAVMLYRYAGVLGLDTKADAEALGEYPGSESISGWASDAMAWATQSGIISGRTDGLAPGATASRAEVAVMLQRLVKLL